MAWWCLKSQTSSRDLPHQSLYPRPHPFLLSSYTRTFAIRTLAPSPVVVCSRYSLHSALPLPHYACDNTLCTQLRTYHQPMYQLGSYKGIYSIIVHPSYPLLSSPLIPLVRHPPSLPHPPPPHTHSRTPTPLPSTGTPLLSGRSPGC